MSFCFLLQVLALGIYGEFLRLTVHLGALPGIFISVTVLRSLAFLFVSFSEVHCLLIVHFTTRALSILTESWFEFLVGQFQHTYHDCV